MKMEAALDTAPLGRRERKKRATRLALKAAALDLVAERGFARVTVEDIADAVDVSVRTFFNYFASKEAAIVGDDPELVEELKTELIGLPPELSPLEALRTILLARIRDIEEDIDRSGEDHTVWMRRFAVVRTQPEVLAAYTRHLTTLEQSYTDALVQRLGGDERWRMYAALVSATALGVTRVAALSASAEAGGSSFVQLATEGFDMLASGLAFPPHRRADRSRTGSSHAAPAGRPS